MRTRIDHTETRGLPGRVDAGVAEHHALHRQKVSPPFQHCLVPTMACLVCKHAWMAQSAGWLACLHGGACGACMRCQVLAQLRR